MLEGVVVVAVAVAADESSCVKLLSPMSRVDSIGQRGDRYARERVQSRVGSAGGGGAGSAAGGSTRAGGGGERGTRDAVGRAARHLLQVLVQRRGAMAAAVERHVDAGRVLIFGEVLLQVALPLRVVVAARARERLLLRVAQRMPLQLARVARVIAALVAA